MTDIFAKKNYFEKWDHVPSKLVYGDIDKCPNPKVTIIMPCYKRVKLFREALDSCLNQDCDFEYEIIVVDNYVEVQRSPIQDIIEEINSPKILYYKNGENLGVMGNWNRGVLLARAEFLTYCHDDDVLLPDCLSRLMRIQKKTGTKLIYSEQNVIDDDNNYTIKRGLRRKRLLPFFKMKEYYNMSVYDMFVAEKLTNGVGSLFYRQHIIDLGGWMDEMPTFWDHAFAVEYCYYYGCVWNNNPTFNYRLGADNSVNYLWEYGVPNREFFYSCILNKIKLPKFLLRKIMSVKLHNYAIAINTIHHPEIQDKLSLNERIIYFLSTYCSEKIKPYKISL